MGFRDRATGTLRRLAETGWMRAVAFGFVAILVLGGVLAARAMTEAAEERERAQAQQRLAEERQERREAREKAAAAEAAAAEAAAEPAAKEICGQLAGAASPLEALEVARTQQRTLIEEHDLDKSAVRRAVTARCGDELDAAVESATESVAKDLCLAISDAVAPDEHGFPPYSAPRDAARVLDDFEEQMSETDLVSADVLKAARSRCDAELTRGQRLAQGKEDARKRAEKKPEEDKREREADRQRDALRGYSLGDFECVNEGDGYFSASGTLKNTDSITHSYRIRVELVDRSGTRIGEASDVINSLAPGRSATYKAFGSHDGDGSNARCSMMDIEVFDF